MERRFRSLEEIQPSHLVTLYVSAPIGQPVRAFNSRLWNRNLRDNKRTGTSIDTMIFPGLCILTGSIESFICRLS